MGRGGRRVKDKAVVWAIKEKSSGQHKGQIKITNRGSGLARRDLYLATLRLINHNEIVSTWWAGL